MGIRHLSLAIPRVAPLCDGRAAEVVHLVGWIRVGGRRRGMGMGIGRGRGRGRGRGKG